MLHTKLPKNRFLQSPSHTLLLHFEDISLRVCAAFELVMPGMEQGTDLHSLQRK